MAELSFQGCCVFYRLYLRSIKKVSSEHHFKKQLWPCGPEVLVNCVVSPSVGYLAPHPMCVATCFLLSLSSSETFPLRLASPMMRLFHTKHPSASSQGSSPGSSLLCSLICPDNATRNLRRNSWLQFCILKILFTLAFTCSEHYFQCVSPLCPAILSFPLDVSEVT